MTEHEIATDNGHLHVDEYPGQGPAVIMTHGYPDDSHIYDRLVPHLAGRHVVTFDFLGHGRSGRELTGPMAPGQRESELAAVIDALGLESPVLVGHDGGGPVVIRYALANPRRVGGMVLLNTFFGDSPTLEFPEFIRLMADPHFTSLVDEIVADPQILGWNLLFTDRRLNPGPPDPEGVGALAILPQFYGNDRQKTAIAAIRAWTANLFPEMREHNAQIEQGELSRIGFPVTVSFGENDRYLNTGVGQHLQTLIPGSALRPVPDAAHWPQWDQPETVAAVIADLS